MPTIRDVAQAAQVSVASVSRVLNNDPKVKQTTRRKIQQVMDDLGYRVNETARALATQKSTTLGVVIPALKDPFFASLAAGVESVARAHGRQILLGSSGLDAESERSAINLLIERHCDAMVVHSKFLSDQELSEFCVQVPGLTLIDRHIHSQENRCFWLDNHEGGITAARHLLALGHSQFACITSSYQIDDPFLRLNGFKSEITKANRVLPDDLIVYDEPNQRGGEMAAQQLISQGTPFTALFVYNDAMAIGAISTLEDNGYKVPNDVSVVGFDDVLLSQYSRPKLTTLHYPIEKMAAQAARLAIGLKEQSLSTNTTLGKFVPLIIKRESTREIKY